jgi:hypothetical protein
VIECECIGECWKLEGAGQRQRLDIPLKHLHYWPEVKDAPARVLKGCLEARHEGSLLGGIDNAQIDMNVRRHGEPPFNNAYTL